MMSDASLCEELASELQKFGPYEIVRNQSGLPLCGVLFDKDGLRILNVVRIPDMVTDFDAAEFTTIIELTDLNMKIMMAKVQGFNLFE